MCEQPKVSSHSVVLIVCVFVYGLFGGGEGKGKKGGMKTTAAFFGLILYSVCFTNSLVHGHWAYMLQSTD